MQSATVWSLVVVVAAAYVAVTSLVRLMRSRRDQVIANFNEQIAKKRGGSPESR